MNDELSIEVCVDALDSAVAAERGGAKRVELCGSLTEAGITPSAGLIATARQKISIGLHVMIRPRAGDFCYTSDEFSAMRRDVVMAKQLGADGVVLGILDADGRVEIQKTRQLVDLARPLKTTYHRAFDMSADLYQSLEMSSKLVPTGFLPLEVCKLPLKEPQPCEISLRLRLDVPSSWPVAESRFRTSRLLLRKQVSGRSTSA